MLTFPLKLTMVNREFVKQETEPRNQTNQKLEPQSCNTEVSDKSKNRVTNPNDQRRRTTMSSIDKPKQLQNPNKSTINNHVTKSRTNGNHQSSNAISISHTNCNHQLSNTIPISLIHNYIQTIKSHEGQCA